MDEPTTEKARRCLVAERVRGTSSSPLAEESVKFYGRLRQRQGDRDQISRKEYYQLKTARICHRLQCNIAQKMLYCILLRLVLQLID